MNPYSIHHQANGLTESPGLQALTPANQSHLPKKKPSLSDEVWRFLGIDPSDSIRLTTEFRRTDFPQSHAAVDRVFAGHRVVRTATWLYFHKEHDWGPEYLNFPLADGNSRSLLVQGIRFVEKPDGERMAIVFRNESAPGELNKCSFLEIIAPAADGVLLRQQMQLIESLIQSLPHYLQGQVVTANAEPIPPTEKPVGLDDVALPDAIRAELLQNTVDLIVRREEYRRWGVPLTRGIILHGRPGNGKSMIGRALAAMKLATFIHVSPEKLTDTGVGELFRLARRLAPAFVFLEDLDFLGGQDHRRFGSPSFAELLVQLDGLDRNDGLIIIATTNNLEAIDPAIRERPSRFDVVIRIDEPESPARQQIIHRQLGHLIDAPQIATATELTAGLSGAQVREVCIRAAQQALHSGLIPSQLAAIHFRTAIQSLYHTAPKSPAGFQVLATEPK